MKRIFKFELPDHGNAQLLLPAEARILHIAYQRKQLQLWAECMEGAPRSIKRSFRIIYTGFDEVPGGAHIGTALFNDGEFVAHVYELPSDGG
jgi:hypothetical protein